jgi:RNA polymerase sigma-70 factor (ECF subfamily)
METRLKPPRTQRAGAPSPRDVGADDLRPGRSAEIGLVRAASRGDPEAWARLYTDHARPVRALLLACAPREDVEDLHQDVFVAALRGLGRLRDPGAFGAWLLRIARHRATDALRRRGRRRTRFAAIEAPDVPVEDAPRAEVREALAALQQLPPAYRETLALRLIGGLDGPAIAERLGLTPGSVRVNLCRGFAKLRALLGET